MLNNLKIKQRDIPKKMALVFVVPQTIIYDLQCFFHRRAIIVTEPPTDHSPISSLSGVGVLILHVQERAGIRTVGELRNLSHGTNAKLTADQRA